MIIIETTTRERLVLVPEERIVCTEHTRDATPEDLARAGYVLRDMTARAEGAELDAAEWAAEVDALRAEALAELADARRERDTLLAELADAKAERDRAIRDCAATAAERNEARAEVARLGVAHERARQQPGSTFVQATGTHTFGGRPRSGQGLPPDAQPDADRATDEELGRAYSAAYARAWESEVSTPDRGERAGVLAVAARVRQERCLIAQAVAANIDVRVCEDNDGRFMVGVHATGCDEELARCVPASDVPATLARLLGEVTRG